MSQLSEILHGGSASGGNSQSIVARLGQLGQKYTDPLAWIFGRKYTDQLVNGADFSNKQFSSVVKPFDKVDQTINPVRRYVPAVNTVGNWIANKPADSLAIAAGAYFGAPALAGAMGGGSGSGAAGTNSGLWNQGFSGSRGFSGASYGSNPAAGISGIFGDIGGSSGGLGSSAGGGLGSSAGGWQSWLKLAGQLPSGGQSASPSASPPVYQARQIPSAPQVPSVSYGVRPVSESPPTQPQIASQDSVRRTVNGRNYVYTDGHWYEEV